MSFKFQKIDQTLQTGASVMSLNLPGSGRGRHCAPSSLAKDSNYQISVSLISLSHFLDIAKATMTFF